MNNKEFSHRRSRKHQATYTDSRGATVDSTALYADIVALQKAMATAYIFLPLWLIVLVSKVYEVDVCDVQFFFRLVCFSCLVLVFSL